MVVGSWQVIDRFVYCEISIDCFNHLLCTAFAIAIAIVIATALTAVWKRKEVEGSGWTGRRDHCGEDLNRLSPKPFWLGVHFLLHNTLPNSAIRTPTHYFYCVRTNGRKDLPIRLIESIEIQRKNKAANRSTEWKRNTGLWVEDGGLHRQGGVGLNPNPATCFLSRVTCPLSNSSSPSNRLPPVISRT